MVSQDGRGMRVGEFEACYGLVRDAESQVTRDDKLTIQKPVTRISGTQTMWIMMLTLLWW